jgi:hypothetical protein
MTTIRKPKMVFSGGTCDLVHKVMDKQGLQFNSLDVASFIRAEVAVANPRIGLISVILGRLEAANSMFPLSGSVVWQKGVWTSSSL